MKPVSKAQVVDATMPVGFHIRLVNKCSNWLNDYFVRKVGSETRFPCSGPGYSSHRFTGFWSTRVWAT